MRLIVLPGMDGGAELSHAFRACLEAQLEVVPLEYPFSQILSYEQLERLVRKELGRSLAPTVLLAESFSGPIAIRVGATPPPNLMGVLLVATFVRPPAPSALRHVVGPYLFRFAPPSRMVRRFMLDADATKLEVAEVLAAIRRTRPEVMAGRAHEVLSVNACADLRAISLPLRSLEAGRDRLVRASLARSRPGIQCDVLDAPHLVLKSRPRAAAEAVSAFCSTINSNSC